MKKKPAQFGITCDTVKIDVAVSDPWFVSGTGGPDGPTINTMRRRTLIKEGAHKRNTKSHRNMPLDAALLGELQRDPMVPPTLLVWRMNKRLEKWHAIAVAGGLDPEIAEADFKLLNLKRDHGLIDRRKAALKAAGRLQ